LSRFISNPGPVHLIAAIFSLLKEFFGISSRQFRMVLRIA